MRNKEYIIFCDESDKSGDYYSNFYGGLLVGSSDYDKIKKILDEEKQKLHFMGEIKWSKVSENYLEKYMAFISKLFEFVKTGNIKIRIMFTQNARRATNLSSEQKSNSYFLLYYQFLKHAFGLKYLPREERGVNLKLMFDEFPETRTKIIEFKKFLLQLNQQDDFKYYKHSYDDRYYPLAPIFILKKENIAEVKSHEHVLLQGLDIILGSMAFRLNNKHKLIPLGKSRRGKKTIAKEKLYKFIYKNICEIRPHFNIGSNTGKDGDNSNSWYHPYRHWLFVPKEYTLDVSLTKKR